MPPRRTVQSQGASSCACARCAARRRCGRCAAGARRPGARRAPAARRRCDCVRHLRHSPGSVPSRTQARSGSWCSLAVDLGELAELVVARRDRRRLHDPVVLVDPDHARHVGDAVALGGDVRRVHRDRVRRRGAPRSRAGRPRGRRRGRPTVAVGELVLQRCQPRSCRQPHRVAQHLACGRSSSATSTSQSQAAAVPGVLGPRPGDPVDRPSEDAGRARRPGTGDPASPRGDPGQQGTHTSPRHSPAAVASRGGQVGSMT